MKASENVVKLFKTEKEESWMNQQTNYALGFNMFLFKLLVLLLLLSFLIKESSYINYSSNMAHLTKLSATFGSGNAKSKRTVFKVDGTMK